jgi:type IV secretory pathway VirB10-like protein
MKQLAVVLVVCAFACGGKKDDAPKEAPKTAVEPAKPAPAPEPAKPAPEPAKPTPVEKGSNAPGPATPNVADAPAGNPPPDGKYEKVMVEGVTVPMVNVMEGGTVVLVDTDGKKPRTWEEQYKKKSAKLAGQLDIHKTDANKNGKFDDDAIDKEGIWLLDVKGNITKH